MKNEKIEQAISKHIESKVLVLMSYPAEYIEDVKTDMACAFRKGAEWMAGQGVSMVVTDDTEWAEVDSFVHKNVCDKVIVQIRKA